MGDSNIDFENTADLMDEDPPLILSNGIHEVFDQFTNMLDIHSFMNLALTNKEMYYRCMNDRRIKINVNENEVSVFVAKDVWTFCFESFDVSEKNIEKYFERLRQLKCNVSLKRIRFLGQQVDHRAILQTRQYLKELGVKRIDSLKVDGRSTCWQELSSFIKNFNIKNVEIGHGLTQEALCSLLQLNLSSFTYHGPIDGKTLLEVDSSIPLLKFPLIQLPADVFTEILWKIQTGALTKLCVGFDCIPYDSYASVTGDDEPLPEERPLLIDIEGATWFLHRDGSVTNCCQFGDFIEIWKCKQYYFPALLKSKETVHKALAEVEKYFEVNCLKRHFESFFDGIPVLDASHKGPFPEERPLLCKDLQYNNEEDVERYYLLKEDGMDIYFWDFLATYEGLFDMSKNWPYDTIYNPPLKKFVLGKRIEKHAMEEFACHDLAHFRSLFEDYEPLPHELGVQLPERYPTVYSSEEDNRIVLYEDGTIVLYRCGNGKYSSVVHVDPCPPWYFPSIMITTENLKEIILKAPFKKFIYNIDLDMFHSAFKEITTLPFHTDDDLSSDRPLVFKKTDSGVEHHWLLLNGGNVRKCEWKDGQATFSRADPREFPLILTKTLVKDFFEGREVNTDRGFYINRDQLNECLADCMLHPFDDSNPHFDERPLIFKKTEVKHTCQENSNSGCCECVDEILRLCFVSDKEEVISITWSAEGEPLLSFNRRPEPEDLTPVFKTWEMLEYLLQKSWILGKRKIRWYGSTADFIRYFEGHRIVDLNHDRRLPRARPLVFKDCSVWRRNVAYWFLRADGVLIMCEKYSSYFVLTVNPSNRPPSLCV